MISMIRLATAALMFLVLLTACPAHAATVSLGASCTLPNAVTTVNNQSNTGGCTHSGSWAVAPAVDTIQFPSTHTIYTITSTLNVSRSVTIQGTTAAYDSVINYSPSTSGSFLFNVAYRTDRDIILTFNTIDLGLTYGYTGGCLNMSGTSASTWAHQITAVFNYGGIGGFNKGAIVSTYGDVAFYGEMAADNYSPGNGGVVNVTGFSHLLHGIFYSDDGSDFEGNSAAGEGGAIYVRGQIHVNDTSFNDNSSGSVGGAISYHPPIANGSSGYLEVYNSSLEENRCGVSTGGGAVYSTGPAEFGYGGTGEGPTYIDYNTCLDTANDVNFTPYLCGSTNPQCLR
jgi:hypothetical protein